MKIQKLILQKVILVFFIFPTLLFSQNKTVVIIEGVIEDNNEITIPYAAIGIPSKQIGTTSNDDGDFYLKSTNINLNDTLEVSSIGYKTFKIKVQDFLNLKIKKLVLTEDVVSLDEITLLNPRTYVKNALKGIKDNHLTNKHQLNIIYRRSSVEHGKTRFLVEQYIKLVDYGPTLKLWEAAEVVESRQSADYRFAFKKQPGHAVNVGALINPLRLGIRANSFNWKRIGDTSYNGEDLLIVEGSEKRNPKNLVTLYIGVDTYGIYKMQLSQLEALYIYKKDREGKLVLSYHNRVAKFPIPVKPHIQKMLKLEKPVVNGSYRHEFIVLEIENDRKKINVNNNVIRSKVDIGDYKIKYNPVFWDSISLPPETNFYKQSVKELESIYGVPIKTQFKFSK